MGPAKYRKRCKNLHRNFQIHVKSKFHYLQLSKHIIGPSTEYLNFECAKNNDVHTCASFRIEIIVYIIYDPDRLCLLWKIANCSLLFCKIKLIFIFYLFIYLFLFILFLILFIFILFYYFFFYFHFIFIFYLFCTCVSSGVISILNMRMRLGSM